MVERREYSTIREIAGVEKVNETYLGRVLRLTLLAPDILEAILCGHLPACVQLDALKKRFPVEWSMQRDIFNVTV
jgi:hypothetical protein